MKYFTASDYCGEAASGKLFNMLITIPLAPKTQHARPSMTAKIMNCGATFLARVTRKCMNKMYEQMNKNQPFALIKAKCMKILKSDYTDMRDSM